jgi:dTDP-4-dehydrorhamnose 3,5-epimerase
MEFTRTPLDGLILIEPKIYKDDRGSFFESYNAAQFEANGITLDFVQDNQSVSKKGVIRGLHFQVGSHAQGKLVRVVQGRALDVVVDLRKESATFGRYFSVELDPEKSTILWIPPGFAHGFEALEDDTIFLYKVTAPYHQPSEAGIRFDDPDLNIRWRTTAPIVSEKDKILPTLREWNSI